jgi:hypothetical protein
MQGMFFPRAVYFGDAQAKANYTLQIGNIVRAGHDKLGEVPVVIGETGFPMDMKYGVLSWFLFVVHHSS